MDEKLFANIQTKERSLNFSKIELDRLQTLLLKYKNVLFCKKTDGVSSKQKESAWSKIQCEFNALADTPRTVKQLKYKFENLKRAAKKGASNERQEMRRTGGGPPPTPPSGLSDATDWLRAIIPSSIDGNEAIYDDDVINQKPTVFPAKKPEKILKEVVEGNITEESHLQKKPRPEDIVIELVEDNIITEAYHLHNKIPDSEKKTNEAAATNEKWDFDPSTPYSSLKRPISSPLKSRAKKRKMEYNNTNVVRQLLREKKLSVMDNLQELELQRINDSIRHAQELHEQTLRHNEERHKLEMEKLEIDIRILKKSDEFM